MDRHYTPDDLAALLVAAVPKRPKFVADFAAGQGALLQAARNRWPDARLLATDLNWRAVEKVKSLKRIKANQCNFLSPISRARVSQLESMKKSVDVVLLNPPFSCRGSERQTLYFADVIVKCSTAMAFVLIATQYLEYRGVLASILPESCMTSDKDRDARKLLAEHFHVEWRSHECQTDFKECSVSVVFAVIRQGHGEVFPPRKMIAGVESEALHTTLIRGTMPMDEAKAALVKRGGRNLIHTTSLQQRCATPIGRVAGAHKSIVKGPAVFVPRVGKFRSDKIAIKTDNSAVVISDCVFALQTKSLNSLKLLHERLIRSADYLSANYNGSCARYITKRRLAQILHNLNISTSLSGIAAAVEPPVEQGSWLIAAE